LLETPSVARKTKSDALICRVTQRGARILPI
jgi:hypothetical protein